MIDIPNYVTLPIELGVALLILFADRRQRNREANSIIRFQEQQKLQRESELRSRERFNNWQQENSKRQIMLLESIMATLDSDKVDFFQKEVGSRYAKEISQDMNDLDELLQKKKDSDEIDPELEADIESKIDEIESAKNFIEHFLPSNVVSDISEIAASAKHAYEILKDLPERLKPKLEKEGKITIHVKDKGYDVDPENPKEVSDLKDRILNSYEKDRDKLFKTINQSIQDAFKDVGMDLLPKDSENVDPKNILESVKSTLFSNKSIGDFVEKAKSMTSTGKENEKEDKERKKKKSEEETSE